MTLDTKNSKSDKSKEYVIHNLQKAQFIQLEENFSPGDSYTYLCKEIQGSRKPWKTPIN